MRIALAADHAGVAMKQLIEARLRAAHEIIDLGGDGSDPEDDYPDYAAALGEAVRGGRAEAGILICGSGIGATIALNKMKGIRAGLCHDTYSARQAREHDDANVLCLGARVIGPSLAFELVDAWLKARFTGEDRHRRRLAKLAELERRG